MLKSEYGDSYIYYITELDTKAYQCIHYEYGKRLKMKYSDKIWDISYNKDLIEDNIYCCWNFYCVKIHKRQRLQFEEYIRV